MKKFNCLFVGLSLLVGTSLSSTIFAEDEADQGIEEVIVTCLLYTSDAADE